MIRMFALALVAILGLSAPANALMMGGRDTYPDPDRSAAAPATDSGGETDNGGDEGPGQSDTKGKGKSKGKGSDKGSKGKGHSK